MFHFRILCLLFVFCFHFVSAENAPTGEEGESDVKLIDLNGLPSGVVGGCVNVITGHYFESEQDLATFGTNPITFHRYYDSGCQEVGELYDFWDLDLKSEVKLEFLEDKPFASVQEKGVKIRLHGEKHANELRVNKKMVKQGVVNVCSPYLSGRCHLLNKEMRLTPSGKKDWISMLRTPGGETLHFGKKKSSKKYLLTEITQPNGCGLRYDYQDNKVNRISALSRAGENMGSVIIDRIKGEDRERIVKLTSDDGKEVAYHISRRKSRHKKGQHRYCLTSVESNFAPEVFYEYEEQRGRKRDKLIKKIFPDNRFLEIAYGSGSKNSKVYTLFAPVGVDETPIPTYSFAYSKRKTKVFDALGNQKIYHWSDDYRLNSIEEHIGSERLYRTEKMVWGKKNSGEESFLKARYMTGMQGKVLLAKTYTYDSRGNILEECLAGNLSGASTVPPRISKEGALVQNGCERLVKTYTYDENNLVLTEKDCKQQVSYSYYPNTALIRQKTVSDAGGIKIRYYYEYDSSGALALEITDDGNSPDINDLSNVSERRIKRVQTIRGLPQVIWQSYLDLATREEVLVKRIANTFSSQGHLIREEVYDCNNRFAFCREWTYDACGHVTGETNPLGQTTTYEYDANGNCVRKQTPNGAFYTVFQYDFSNRLIKEEEIHADGARFSKSYAYDYKGNRTKEVDIYGNETRFLYDSFDRLVKKVLPQVPDVNGRLFFPEEVYSYNELNQPVKKQDAANHVTAISCNLYGKPATVKHPDGSIEQILYNLDGTAREAIDALGTKTLIDYDYQGRKIREEMRSSDGELLSEKHWIYNAFHLMQEIDPEGIVTTYRYDGAGRMTACVKGNSETLYFYDFLGRQTQKWELYEQGRYRVTALEHDLLDRIVEERIESESGELFSQKHYEYDLDGNKTRETVSTSNGPCTTTTLYNSHGQAVKVIAPDGSETALVYRYDFRDAYNLPVSFQQVIDPKGGIVTIIGNALGKTALEERKNIFGETVQKTASIFDPCGHLLRKIEDVIVSNEKIRTHITAFEYDPRGREIAVFEAYGDPLQKVTRKEYNGKGDVTKIYKPDGVVLAHEYDPLGRLQRLKSSDERLHYVYSYDRNHNILSALDASNGAMTKRCYDEEGRLSSETLSHGLTLAYAYDRMGRLKELELPDSSHISYAYNAKHLCEIERGGQVHSYHYDLSGKLSAVELMYGCGELRYGYDSCLRPTSITSPHWEMRAVYDALGNMISGSQKDPLGEIFFQYGYDDLEQLTSEIGFSSHAYTFDSLGNRLQKDDAVYEINALNQLERQSMVSYSYDLNGNLVQKGDQSETLTLTYDPLDRLIEVTRGKDKTSYQYDPLHRRLSKSSFTYSGGAWVETLVERYMYQGDKEIGAVDQSGTIQELRVMGIGCQGDVGAAVLMEIGGRAYVPLHDYRGNVSLLLDSRTGEAVETYRYSAYGEELTISSKISPWRFSSKRVDDETGWVFFGRRHYDPTAGRWTTPDPLWFVDGTNLYCFIGNAPTQFIDPEGLFLKSLFNLFVDAFISMFEWMSDGNFNFDYKDSGMTMCANIPISTSQETGGSLDKRSHIYETQNATYGPVKITNINGINTPLKDAHGNSRHLQELTPGYTKDGPTPYSISGVYNASHGFWDIVECIFNFIGINSKPVSLLHKQWDAHFDKYGDNGIIIHVCHSQGAILTRNALACYDPEKRKRIHVIAVAPGAYIDKELCGSVIHFVSTHDFVPWIDFIGRYKHRDTVKVLKRHPKASLFDHDFKSHTFKKHIQEHLDYLLLNVQ